MGLFVLGKQVTSPFPSFSGFGGGRGQIRLEKQLLRAVGAHEGTGLRSLTSADLLKDSAVGGAQVTGVCGISWSRHGGDSMGGSSKGPKLWELIPRHLYLAFSYFIAD